jgi:hypothetical protein
LINKVKGNLNKVKDKLEADLSISQLFGVPRSGAPRRSVEFDGHDGGVLAFETESFVERRRLVVAVVDLEMDGADPLNAAMADLSSRRARPTPRPRADGRTYSSSMKASRPPNSTENP